jgi:organic hydroperoxide reductase OsmC/OhrA
MSEHNARVTWKRATEGFGYEEYNRGHEWRFEGGEVVRASSAPQFRGDPERVDPEAAFAAALSSCHMLTFLAVAARRRLVVDSYEDEATAFLEKGENGKLQITRVVLRPRVAFSGEKRPDAAALAQLHERAHAECFLANSVKTAVSVEARD